MRLCGVSARYQRLAQDIEVLGISSPTALHHSIRATFRALLEVSGANTGVIRRATHGAPSDVLGGYLRPPWPDQCREFAKLRLGRRGRANNVVALPGSGRSSAPSGASALAEDSKGPKF